MMYVYPIPLALSTIHKSVNVLLPLKWGLDSV